MPTPDNEYERQHLRNLGTYQDEIEAEYLATIEQIFQTVGLYAITGEVFRLDRYPTLKGRIEEQLRIWRDRVYTIITRAIGNEFNLSDSKAAKTLEAAYGEINPIIRERFTTPGNVPEFVERKVRRLTLSDRVWKLHDQFYSEIEKTLYAGIAEGKAAKSMASDMKRFLKEPDRLFRRVRDARGRLVLSGPAKNYKPGQGVYRSSFKNSLRLVATETNAAYRTADTERWRATPFVLGYEVKLSRNHKTFDVCDNLAGEYPASFRWQHWHPNCMCYCIPVMASKEEFLKYQQAVLAGTEQDFKFTGRIKDTPPQFKTYVLNNMEQMEGWKRLPFWVTDNRRFIKPVLQ